MSRTYSLQIARPETVDSIRSEKSKAGILKSIQAYCDDINNIASPLSYCEHRCIQEALCSILTHVKALSTME